MPCSPFTDLTLQTATEKLPKPSATAAEVRDFILGDHCRDGQAWIGERDSTTSRRSVRAPRYPLTLPAVSPSTMYFWA